MVTFQSSSANCPQQGQTTWTAVTVMGRAKKWEVLTISGIPTYTSRYLTTAMPVSWALTSHTAEGQWPSNTNLTLLPQNMELITQTHSSAGWP